MNPTWRFTKNMITRHASRSYHSILLISVWVCVASDARASDIMRWTHLAPDPSRPWVTHVQCVAVNTTADSLFYWSDTRSGPEHARPVYFTQRRLGERWIMVDSPMRHIGPPVGVIAPGDSLDVKCEVRRFVGDETRAGIRFYFGSPLPSLTGVRFLDCTTQTIPARVD